MAKVTPMLSLVPTRVWVTRTTTLNTLSKRRRGKEVMRMKRSKKWDRNYGERIVMVKVALILSLVPTRICVTRPITVNRLK